MLRALSVFLVAVASACAPGSPAADPGPASDASPAGEANRWRTDPREPYPFTTPIPPHIPTEIDGTYYRDYERGSKPIPCRRCAPYRLNRGWAVLRLDAGRFELDHPAWDFRATGHFAIEGDRITLFNDAVCPTTRGTYRWSVAGDTLRFEVVEDDCAFDLLRARYFSVQGWERATA